MPRLFRDTSRYARTVTLVLPLLLGACLERAEPRVAEAVPVALDHGDDVAGHL